MKRVTQTNSVNDTYTWWLVILRKSPECVYIKPLKGWLSQYLIKYNNISGNNNKTIKHGWLKQCKNPKQNNDLSSFSMCLGQHLASTITYHIQHIQK